MTDPRDSIKRSLFAYLDRTEKERIKSHTNRTKQNNNNKPEKLVEKVCTAWLIKNGFDGQVYESKAVLSGGEWRKAGMSYGHSDWGGTSPFGESVFIEFKAPGKRSTFWRKGNERQTDFILSKIEKHAFAIVVDKPEDIERWYSTWRSRKHHDPASAKQYLLGLLPKRPERVIDDSPLFDE